MPDDRAGIIARPGPLAASTGRREARGRAYVVPCATAFRDRVTALAAQRGVSAGDLARAVLLLVPRGVVMRATDPGEPRPEDREVVKLRSGASKGRVLRRKPRLQLRLPTGHGLSELRRALALALDLAAGEQAIALETDDERRARDEAARVGERLTDEVAGLRRTIEMIALQPLENGVTSRGEALHVLGFSPMALPDRDAIRSRYRNLARVYHPDAPHGDDARMSLLNQALDKLILF
jgi:hypothetical protein